MTFSSATGRCASFAKRCPFCETLPGPRESIYPRRFDLLILDEAHNVAPAGRGRYATDSLRTEALRRIAPHFEHKLFLSATPHNGYTESFTALLDLRADQMSIAGQLLRRHMRKVKPDLISRILLDLF